MHISESVSDLQQNKEIGSITHPGNLDDASEEPDSANGFPHFEAALEGQSGQSSNPTPPLTLTQKYDWLRYFDRCSRLLVAVIEPTTLKLWYANDYFCQLTGTTLEATDSTLPHQPSGTLATVLQQKLSEADNAAVQRLYRRHVLYQVLCHLYRVNPRDCRLLDAPVMLSLYSPVDSELHHVEFWLRSEQLMITRLEPEDEFADLGLQHLSAEEQKAKLIDPVQLEALEYRLRLENYRVEGNLLLEGVDVTERETIRQITQLLIDRDSILQPEKFGEVNQQMRSLFQAQNTVVVSIESEQVRLFTGSIRDDIDNTIYPLDLLQNSYTMQAMRTNRVLTVPDLEKDCRSDFGRKLLELGIRSALLIPLVADPVETAKLQTAKLPTAPKQSAGHPSDSLAQVIGLIGVMSDRPNNFDALDCRHAEQLIPPFTAALAAAQRLLVQQRFITNIHPSVEWRFLQEAERRSLGLPPEPIVFTNVYPLYGISDIRGSSDERNRAIQSDLLEQFQLGLAVVETACANQETALGEQLRLDLLEQIHQLEEKVTVDAEVSQLRYLRDNLEVYFEYFAQCGEAAIAAIETYRAACANDHSCVYHARASYDATIGQINALLRETWEQWQARMQRISPHYCDIEATDGIDHMIYAGESIDPKFGSFQLRSLRYEQLRAVCDCARTAFRIQEEYNTQMQVTHLVLVQDSTVDIFHDETTERLFDVRGTRDTRYEIVKKRIDKALDEETQTRITQPGMLTLVHSTEDEWNEYQQYFRYLLREGWVDAEIERGFVQPLQGVSGLKYARVRVLPQVQ